MTTQAMQRSMPASTSYARSVPISGLKFNRMPRQQSARNAQNLPGTVCNAYRQQNCGSRYGPRWGFLNQMAGGPSAAQLEEMMQEFARQFGNSRNVNGMPRSGERPTAYLPMDMEEQEAQYILTADIPGLQKADLKISVNQTDRTLKIAGERQRSSDKVSEAQDESRPRFRKQLERSMGKFSRTVVLDKAADLSAVSARVDKGVLTITVQKKDLAKEEDEIRVDID